VSVTLRCLKCEGQELVKPTRLHRKSILTCRTCSAIALYGDLLEAAGQRLMADIKQRLPLMNVG